MRIKEFFTRYATGIVDDVPCVVENTENQPTAILKMERHEAGFGDFVRDYIEHLKTPWWKKDWGWAIVERTMRQRLNETFRIRWHR